MKGIIFLLGSFFCLLAGSVVYVLYKPSVFFIHSLFSASALASLQEKLNWVKCILPNSAFTRYQLSDILWYQSLLFLLFYVYHIQKIFKRGVLYFFSLFLPFILEFSQLFRLIPGTFDWVDIFFYAILLFINYFFYFRRK